MISFNTSFYELIVLSIGFFKGKIDFSVRGWPAEKPIWQKKGQSWQAKNEGRKLKRLVKKMDQGLYFTKKKQNRSNSWLQQPLFYQEPPFSSSRKVNKGINVVSDDHLLCTVLKPIIFCFFRKPFFFRKSTFFLILITVVQMLSFSPFPIRKMSF